MAIVGYGKGGYGLTEPYGSVNIIGLRILNVVSNANYDIEVFFSEELFSTPNLLLTSSYSVTNLIGAPASITSVVIGELGPVAGQPTSIRIQTSGLTRGGTYTLNIPALLQGITGVSSSGLSYSFYSYGEGSVAVATPIDATTISLEFTPEILSPGLNPGIEDLVNYSVDTDFPVPLVLENAEYVDSTHINFTVSQQTSTNYDLLIGLADTYSFNSSDLGASTLDYDFTGAGSYTQQADSINLINPIGEDYIFTLNPSGLTEDYNYQCIANINFSSLETLPTLTTDPPLLLEFYDGVCCGLLTFYYENSVGYITINWGSSSTTIIRDWLEHTSMEVIKNQLAGHYGFLMDGEPIFSILSASFTRSPEYLNDPGLALVLTEFYDIQSLDVGDISFELSETIYNLGWNFIHNNLIPFVGSSLGTQDSFYTEKGPLVKDWGSSTPATPEDIIVLVNDVRVSVREVNPYTGKVTLSTPLPLTAPGTVTVETTYAWFSNPTFPLAKLNYPGLVLNKWNYHQIEHNYPNSNTGLGAIDEMRFPYSVVLGPYTPKQPISIAHRFLALEKEYSAVLNSPLSLRLNQDPHASRLSYLEKEGESESFIYNGDTLPSEQGWLSVGNTDSNTVVDGVLVIRDQLSESVDSDGENVSLYYTEINDSLPGLFLSAQRFQRILSEEETSLFSGIGYGYTDQRNLYLVGLLFYNNLHHLGLLKNTLYPESIDSWEILAKKEIRILDQKHFQIPKAVNFSKVEIGAKFQIITGNQTSVQTISWIDYTDRNNVVFTIEGNFPQSPALWGDRDVFAYFEIDFISNPVSTILRILPETNILQVDLSGSLSGTIYEQEYVSSPITNEHLTLLLPDNEKGTCFWGSCSRVHVNSSKWSLIQTTYSPEPKVYSVDDDIVSTDMDTYPTEDLNSRWDRLGSFGIAQPDQISSGYLNLTKTSFQDVDFGYTFGYKRTEPFLTPTTYSDFELSFKINASSSDSGQPVFKINDTLKEITLGCLSYLEYSPGSIPFRKLVSTPKISIIPQIPLTEQEIDLSGFGNLALTQTDQYLDLDKNSLLSGGVLTQELDLAAPDWAIGSRRFILQAALVSHSISGANTRLPIYLGFGAGLDLSSNVRVVYLQWKYQTTPTPQAYVCLTDFNHNEIASVAFDWVIEDILTYKLNVDPIADTVDLYIEDALIISTDYSLFMLGGSDSTMYVGSETTNTSTTLRIFNCGLTTGYLSGVHRTLGILSGNNPEDIDSWSLPRTDSYVYLPNSSETTTVEDMDWTLFQEIRIHRDPEWGVSVFRPDLAPPPFFDGEFFNEITEPSAAWINVEYRNLVSNPQSFGSVTWGALAQADWLDSQWDYIRYHLFANKENSNIVPRKMLLNQYNVVSSGDLATTNKPIEVMFTSETSTLIELSSLNLRALRIFYVYDDNRILDSRDFSFDYERQEILFNAPLSSERKTVSVVFTPDTNHLTESLLNIYLEHANSQTILNENTPYIPWNKLRGILKTITVGNVLNDEDSILNTPDFVLNDYLRTIEFEDDSEWEFDCAKFFALEDSGELSLLTSICDDNTLEGGLQEISFVDDTFFEDNINITNNYGSLLPLTPFILSGGEGVYSLLGPDSQDIFYPNYVPGLSEDPNAASPNIVISIELEDLVSGLTFVYQFV